MSGREEGESDVASTEIELKKIATVKVSKRGGSLQVTVPKLIRERWEIKEGDRLSFFIQEGNLTYIFIMKEREVKSELPPLFGKGRTIGVFSSPVTVEELKRLLKEANTR